MDDQQGRAIGDNTLLCIHILIFIYLYNMNPQNFTKFTSVFILYFNIPWTYKPGLINILICWVGLLNLHKT